GKQTSAALAPPITMLVMVRLHWPLLEMGKGSKDLQSPTVWMTSGSNPRSGGTSMTGHSALATTVRLITGLSGSSLTIRSVQLLGPHALGVKRMTTSTQKSWLTAAGNGLLTSVKSAQGPTNEI